MAHLYKFPNDRVGFDSKRNLLVMPQNKESTFYLVAGENLVVDSLDYSIFTVNAQMRDDMNVHKRIGLSDWERSQNIRKLILKSGNNIGSAKLTARDSMNNDQILPLEVFVVADNNSRRVTSNVGVEPTMVKELQQLSLRQAVIRIAQDQINSGIKTNYQACGLYDIASEYVNAWCGFFAYWCWRQATFIKNIQNPFDNKNVLASPQKIIDWGMRDYTPGQLLQYKGPNPMTMRGESQELREIGYSGYYVEPGDIVCWRGGHSMDFKHVALVEEVNGTSFIDLNGNAYDAGSGSVLARILHNDIGRKLPDGSYKCFFLHLLI